jgi:large conductance mechanosensitive channel
MLKEFKQFLIQGNLIALAVAFVIGTAFAAVITALVKDLITPLIAAIGGQPNFSALNVKVNHSALLYGDFINAIITFIVVALVIFFLVVKPSNALLRRAGKLPPPPPPMKNCPECTSSIPAGAHRCPLCTSMLDDAA